MSYEEYNYDSDDFQGDLNCPILRAKKDGILFGKRRRPIRVLECENCPVAVCYKDLEHLTKTKQAKAFIREINNTMEELGAIKEYIYIEYLHRARMFVSKKANASKVFLPPLT